MFFLVFIWFGWVVGIFGLVLRGRVSFLLRFCSLSGCHTAWKVGCANTTPSTYNTSTPESPLFQEALSPVDCNSFHHLKEF